ncbi:MAG: acyltransferase [Acidobacteria bacterium]|nr:acyltransferase [Acidobacteriota bacterium]
MSDWFKRLSKEKPPAALAFAAMRGTALVRGWFLKQVLVFIWRAKVGKRLTCFGWPRNILLFGKCEIGDSVHIGRFSYLQSGVDGILRIESNTSIGDFATIAAEESIVIGRDVMMAESVSIRDFDHCYGRGDVPMHAQGMVTSPVRIQDDVWIGTNVTILKGSEIGQGCIIGANAVVKRQLEPFAIAAGVPARTIKKRFDGEPAR